MSGSGPVAPVVTPVVTPVGARTHWEVGGPPPAGAVEVRAPVGVIAYEPADMTITVGAGTSFETVDGVLAEHGQECALDPFDAVGPPIAVVARSARSILVHGRRPSVASWRAACRVCAGCGTDRCAITCSKCASRRSTAGW